MCVPAIEEDGSSLFSSRMVVINISLVGMVAHIVLDLFAMVLIIMRDFLVIADDGSPLVVAYVRFVLINGSILDRKVGEISCSAEGENIKSSAVSIVFRVLASTKATVFVVADHGFIVVTVRMLLLTSGIIIVLQVFSYSKEIVPCISGNMGVRIGDSQGFMDGVTSDHSVRVASKVDNLLTPHGVGGGNKRDVRLANEVLSNFIVEVLPLVGCATDVSSPFLDGFVVPMRVGDSCNPTVFQGLALGGSLDIIVVLMVGRPFGGVFIELFVPAGDHSIISQVAREGVLPHDRKLPSIREIM